MKTIDRIKSMNAEEMALFLREVYLAGKNGYGFAFCDYNIDTWLDKENKEADIININKGLEE